MTFKSGQTEFLELDFLEQSPSLPAPLVRWTAKFAIFKFVCDKVSAIVALPLVVTTAALLLLVNPFLNPGPLFYTQYRMGMGGKRFKMWKFRSMSKTSESARAHDAALEKHRITPFAGLLRKYRVDELPNFFNVLIGQMSLVGPRPDVWDHSTQYVHNIARYGDRFRVRPGITGLAQVASGYADTINAVRRKARLDHLYVKKSRIKMDLYIIGRTFNVIFTGFGGR
ncbi:MAG: sugar transferase [Pseudomonadota bacterium]